MTHKAVAFCLPFWRRQECSAENVKYGNRGCGVFKGGVQNEKGFCIRINMPKENY